MSIRIKNVFVEAFRRGFQNLPAISGNTVLWMASFIVPYLNIGTTLNHWVGTPLRMKGGQRVKFGEVYDGEYCRNFRLEMSGYFLLLFLLLFGTLTATAFFMVPGIVALSSWYLAPYLMADENLTPPEALKRSNDLTKGSKAALFFSILFLLLVLSIPSATVHFFVGNLWIRNSFDFIWFLVISSIMMGANSYLYEELSK